MTEPERRHQLRGRFKTSTDWCGTGMLPVNRQAGSLSHTVLEPPLKGHHQAGAASPVGRRMTIPALVPVAAAIYHDGGGREA